MTVFIHREAVCIQQTEGCDPSAVDYFSIDQFNTLLFKRPLRSIISIMQRPVLKNGWAMFYIRILPFGDKSQVSRK